MTSTIFAILGISVASKVSKTSYKNVDLEYVSLLYFCFTLIQESIPFLYGMAAMGIFQLGTYCALGTVVEHSVQH